MSTTQSFINTEEICVAFFKHLKNMHVITEWISAISTATFFVLCMVVIFIVV